MDPENCACSSFILSLLRTKLHFGLLQLLDVFEVGSQLCQSLTSQPVRMSNAVLSLPAGAGEEFRSLDATPFSTPDPVHPAVPDLIRPSKSEVRKSFPCTYRKRLTMHEIERVAEESTSGREDGQRAYRGDKQAKPAPLNFASR